MGRKQIDRDTFIRTWETSDSAIEVSQKLGITAASASMRASTYRRKYGVGLKKMEKRGGGGAPRFDKEAALATLEAARNGGASESVSVGPSDVGVVDAQTLEV